MSQLCGKAPNDLLLYWMSLTWNAGQLDWVLPEIHFQLTIGSKNVNRQSCEPMIETGVFHSLNVSDLSP